MNINQLPRLSNALYLLSLDNGGIFNEDAEIPEEWKMDALVAEDELFLFNEKQTETFVFGDQDEMAGLVKLAPTADKVLNSAFDGDLNTIFFSSSVYDDYEID